MKYLIILLIISVITTVSSISQNTVIFSGNKGNVNSIAFSGDSKILVSGDENGNLVFYDIPAGTINYSLKTNSNITSINFSVSGELLAYTSYEGEVTIMNAATHEILKNFSIEGNVYYAAFSPDGTKLAIAYVSEPNEKQQNQGIRMNYIVNIYETGKYTKQKTLRLSKTNDDDGEKFGAKLFETYRYNAFNCEFNPGGNYLASGSMGKNIAFYSFDYNKFAPEYKGHSKRVLFVTFSPDGTYLASASKDENVKLWNVTSAGTIITLKGHTSAVNSASFSSNSNYVATCSNDETVKVWNVKTSKLLTTLNSTAGEVYTVKFSPDGKYLAAAGSNDKVFLWETSGFLPQN